MQLVPIDFDPFGDNTEAYSYATTEAQREIFTNIIFGGDAANCSYNESVTLVVEGALNVQALQQAIDDVLAKHEALRSTFSEDGTGLTVQPTIGFEHTLIDLSLERDGVNSVEYREILLGEVTASFDLINGPLLDFKIIKFSDSLFHLLITAHHIICDGWSIGIIMQDVAAFYNQYAANVSYPYEETIAFKNYSEYEQQLHSSDAFKTNIAYWKNILTAPLPVIDLPIDNTRPALRTYNAMRIDREIPSPLVDKIKAAARKNGCSLVNYLIGTFEIFLHKLTCSNDIIFGLPTAGQNAAGMNRLVGHCVNLLPLRTHINDKETFNDYIKQRKKAILDALDHQEVTVGSIISAINITRDASRIPLTPAAFNVDMGIAEGLEFANCKTSFVSNARQFENFEIFFNITGNNGQLIIENTFNSNLFDEQTMQNHTEEYIQLLQAVVENGDYAIKNIDLITEKETQNFDLWNDTFFDFDTALTLPKWFESSATKFAKNIAIDDGKRTITYEELNASVNQLSQYLSASGLLPNQLAAFCLPRSIEMVIAMIAIQKAGAAYIPIDPEYPAERIQYMLHDSKAPFVITNSALQEQIKFDAPHIVLLDDSWKTNLKATNHNPPMMADSGSPAYIRYTSGSTGNPKGVVIRQLSIVNLISSFQRILNFSSTDKLLAVTTISFDISELEIFLPLVSGASIYLASRDEAVDVRLLAKIIETKNISTMQATPATWRAMLDMGWIGNQNLTVLCGGEALTSDVAAFLANNCKRAINVYGPTETTVWSSYFELQKTDNELEAAVKLGKGIDNTMFYILDANLKRVPPGVEGEIFIGGVGLAAGYFNQPALTAERFIIDPFDFSGLTNIYKTGDKGKFDFAGNLIYTGRTDFQVKVRGYRIELGEIENAINSFDNISGSAVITRPDSTGQNNLYAYVVAQNNFAKAQLNSGKGKDQQYIKQNVDDDYNVALNEIKRFSHLQLRSLLKYGLHDNIAVMGGDHILLIPKIHNTYKHYTAVCIDKEEYAATKKFVANENLSQTTTVQFIDDFISQKDGSSVFDTFIIDGESLYFNSANSFIDFISVVTGLLKSGGQLIILNVRSNALEHTRLLFHELEHQRIDATIGRINQKVNELHQSKKGLRIDPEFFEQNKAAFNGFEYLQYVANDVPTTDESKYFYNVIAGMPLQKKYEGPTRVLNYKKDIGNKLRINHALSEHIYEVKVITDIPCEHLLQEAEARNLVELANANSILKDLKVLYQSHGEGVTYAELKKLADSREYYLKLNFSSSQRDAKFDAVFMPYAIAQDYANFNIEFNAAETEDVSFTNVEEENIHEDFPFQELKHHLESKLPAYMIPQHYMLLEQFLLTPAGKIDRKALPEIKSVAKRKNKTSYKLSDTEKKLIPIWEQLLGVSNINPDDNFFELGGHSLMAVKLIIEIENKTTQRLPLAILFSNPTVHALSKLIDAQSNPTASEIEVWDSVTTIRGSGELPPVFFAHGVSGNVFKYYALGKLLNEEVPVYGLQGYGLNGKDEPFYDMKLMAAYHVKEVLKIQPKGPYYIGGGSFGGILAYEMAQQLTQAGYEVAMVGLFDVEAAKKTEFMNPLKKQITEISLKSQRAVNRIKLFTQSSIGDNLQYLKAKMHNADDDRKHMEELLNKDKMAEEYGNESAAYFNKMEDACYTAMKNYKIEPYPGKVTLFRAIDGFYNVEYDEDLGWGFYAEGGCDVVNVPGTHNGIFEHPHVVELAKAMQQVLDNTYTKLPK